MDVVRARWSSSSFLLYAGAFVVLFAAIALLSWLASEHSDGAFFGWSALVFAVLAVVAIGFEAAGERVTAGLFAFVSLIMFSVFVGSFEDLIGILDAGDGPFEGFRWGLLLFDLVIITASLILLARFRFPLLVLPAVFMSWFFLVDLVSGGGNWSAVVSIIVGFFLMLVGAGVDRIYGFWIHFVAALAIGGGFIYLWHGSTWEWILIGAHRAPLLPARGRARPLDLRGARARSASSSRGRTSSRGGPTPRSSTPSIEGVDPPGFSSDSGEPSVWGAALLYALFGLVLVAIGLWLERRRPAEARRAFHPVAPTYNWRRERRRLGPGEASGVRA